MTSQDLPLIPGQSRRVLPMGELLGRVDQPQARWSDLPVRPGLYLVLWSGSAPLHFRAQAGAEGEALRRRWQQITSRAPTDILYLARGDSLRRRISQMARFARGRAADHPEGRELWWVEGIEQAEILVQTCPAGLEAGFENAALERFCREHDQPPLANPREQPGVERWWPGCG